uniref:aminotransferase class III-fold pyridoxal phosphate-dependent enzyme n=1 Tax=Pseudolysinimonas sp. TaxID=2680009 RepID=UPI00286D4B27
MAELTAAVIDRLTVRGTPLVERLQFLPAQAAATAEAVRAARAATGRDLIVTFAGHDHGLIEAPSLVVAYNDLDAVRDAFSEHPGRIAAVITEAAGVNAGVLAPLPGFNGALALVVQKRGALLVLDETHTGFRVGPAGWWGLEAAGVTGSTGWRPDLVILGGFGGGASLAALGGPAVILGRGPVASRAWNADAREAALATLRHATPEVYARADRVADVITIALHESLAAAGVAHVIPRAGSLFSVA